MKIVLSFFIALLISGCSLLPYKSEFSEGVDIASGKSENAIKNRKHALGVINKNSNTADVSEYK